MLDLNMPGMLGIQQVTRRLDQAASLTRVVMLTVSQDEEDVLTAFLAGVDAYVLKDWPIEDVVEAVRTVRDGGAFMSARVARQLGRRTSPEARRQSSVGHRLSEQELLVLDLLASSMNLRQIGTDAEHPERGPGRHQRSAGEDPGRESR